jgi:hypothetical protein
VDHPDTQARKRRLLGTVPSRVRFVPVDFDREQVEAALHAAGYDRDRATLFIWEGVTNYLTEGAVDGTLRWCARAAPSRRLVLTYVHRTVLDDPASFVSTPKPLRTLDASGSVDRWMDPAGLAGTLGHAAPPREDVSARVSPALHGTPSTAMRGYEFYRIACARTGALTPDAAEATDTISSSTTRTFRCDNGGERAIRSPAKHAR